MNPWYAVNQRCIFMLFTTLYHLRMYGREHLPTTGGALVACNHQSFFDPFICGCCVNREMVYTPRDSLFRFKLVEKYLLSVNAFPIKRGQADTGAIKDIIRRLRGGQSIVLFPEGTRSHDGRIENIKSGFDLIARRSEVPVIPAAVDGAHEVWPRKRLLPRAMGHVSVMYGEAIAPEYVKSVSREELNAELTRRLRDLQNQLRRVAGKAPYDYETPQDVQHA